MTTKTMSFTQFMGILRTTTLVSEGAVGISFLTETPNGPEVFMALTPCLNIRSKNFVGLFYNELDESLQMGSLYIAEDCPAIFDKQNRSEFFDAVRSLIKTFSQHIKLLACSSNGLVLNVVGERTQICIAGTVMLEFAPVSPFTAADVENQVVMKYRSVHYLVTSRYFTNVSFSNRELFAYQFVGNVYAKDKSSI